jgi:hypothetical protein
MEHTRNQTNAYATHCHGGDQHEPQMASVPAQSDARLLKPPAEINTQLALKTVGQQASNTGLSKHVLLPWRSWTGLLLTQRTLLNQLLGGTHSRTWDHAKETQGETLAEGDCDKELQREILVEEGCEKESQGEALVKGPKS